MIYIYYNRILPWKLSIKTFKKNFSPRFNMQSRSCHTIYMCHFWRLAGVVLCILLVWTSEKSRSLNLKVRFNYLLEGDFVKHWEWSVRGSVRRNMWADVYFGKKFWDESQEIHKNNTEKDTRNWLINYMFIWKNGWKK